MNILYLASAVDTPRPDNPGLGGTSHMVEVARNLTRLGLKVTVFCRGRSHDSQWMQHEGINIRRLFRGSVISVGPPRKGLSSAARTPFLYATRFIQSLSDAFKIIMWSRQNKINVIYERVNRYSVAGTIASKFLGVPFVAEVNDLNFHEITVRLAAAIVVPEPQSLKPSLRAKSSKLSWGVDTERIYPIEPSLEIKNLLKLGQGPTVVFVGSFLPWHGAMSLVRAAPLVIESQPHVRFVLIGSGPDESKTRDEVRSLNLSNNFIFTGFVPHEEINKYLSVGDVMVAPYSSELGAEQGRAEMGRSFKVLEYMAAAKPVVVTAVANLGGTIEHGVAGLVIENDEPKVFAEAINSMLADPAKSNTMGREGRLAVEEHYTWLRHAEAVRDIFQNVVSRK